MKDLPKRKPNRLRGCDYSQKGAYFVTICTKDRAGIFDRIARDGLARHVTMGLSEYIENSPVITI
jgi:hypothetical protein